MLILDTEVFSYFTNSEIHLIKDKILRYSLDDRFYENDIFIIKTIIFT